MAVGLMARGCLEDRAEKREIADFERSVVESAMRQVADLPSAKIVSIATSRGSTACGWIHLNPDIGSVPFYAIRSAKDDEGTPVVLIPRLDSTNLDAWADAVVSKQLNFELCGTGRNLPKRPPDAHSSAAVEDAVSGFWRPHPPVWVIIPKQAEGYLAIRRMGGGGTVNSPLFTQHADALQWAREWDNKVVIPNSAE